MIYPYECPNGHQFEVIKCVADIDLVENCPECGKIGNRYISRTYFYGAGDWDKAEYNPGLGCVTKNAKHRKMLAKARGLEEIGNENVSKVLAANEKDRNAQIDTNFEKSFEETAFHLNKALRTG